MAGLPTIQVLLDDGTGTFPYDITTYARLIDGITVTRGRSDELSDISPGTLALSLDNTDGRFTLGSTIIASPSPIKVDQRIRVRLTANATTVNRSTGYAQSWPVRWPAGGQEFAVTDVTATDALARAERRPIPPVGQEEIPNYSPSVFYPLAEPVGSTAGGDLSGNNKPPLRIIEPDITWSTTDAEVVFGNVVNNVTGVLFAGGQTLAQYDFTPTGTPGFMVSFNTEFSTAGNKWILSDAEGQVYLRLNAGQLNASGTTLASGLVLNDGQWHTVGVRITSSTTMDVYVDGVRTDVGASCIFTAGGRNGVLVGGWDGTGETNANFQGTIGYVTAWATAPSHANFLALTNLVGNNGEGETGAARLTRVAGYVGIPVGTFDTGLTALAGISFDGSTAGQIFNQTIASEGGLVFANGSGDLTFHNRNRVPLKTSPDFTLDANQLSEDTAFEVDAQGLVNYFEATASGGTGAVQVASDTTSETNHGRYATTVTYDVLTDDEARDRAAWIVATHAEPKPRLGALTLDVLTLSAANQAAVLALEPNSWIRITGLPSQTPGGTTADLIIQGLTESVSLTDWSITFNVISREIAVSDTGVWILGDAVYGVLGTTTKLYY